MITITSYLHRDLLQDIIQRWMYGESAPRDADLITRLVHFNSVFVRRYLHLFAERVLTGLHGEPLATRAITTKGELKDLITLDPPVRNSRTQALIDDYRRTPGRFYRETPCNGTLYGHPMNPGFRIVGSTRIKRVRRLAEKTARRLVDRIFRSIRKKAEMLADERARRLGIPREYLVSGQEEMAAEFLRAEEKLMDDLREKRPVDNEERLVINDVAGMKVILPDEEMGRLTDLLATFDDCEVVEYEPHTGVYNATNLIVRFRPPRRKLLDPPLSERLLTVMARRGVSPDEARRQFVDFVHSGEETVHLEIIVSNWVEMLESEIGRCMHEDRIIRQRMEEPYQGHLAKNIGFLMEYLFAFPASGKKEIGDLPLRLWNRYLPDYFNEVFLQLFEIPTGELQV